MPQPRKQQHLQPHPWWVPLNEKLWMGLRFLWVTVILGIILNVVATALTTRGFDLRGTPLEWVEQHLLLVLICAVVLLLVTIASSIVSRRYTSVSPAESRVLANPTPQQRLAFIKQLREEYKRQLTQSLLGAAMQLQLQERTDAVDSPAQLVTWRLDDRKKASLASSNSIIEVYDHARAGLLILGAPGAGKSTLLRELAGELVSRAENDSTLPIPVILNLSSWAQQKLPLEDWLVDQLLLVYAIPRNLGRTWIEQNQLLFLLDGLDEVTASARGSCIDAINTFRGQHHIPLVMSSRNREYDSLPRRLKAPLAVKVQPLTPEQVNTYLEHVGTSTAAVREALRTNPTLRELIKTPLMLSIVMLTYQGKQAEDLPSLGTTEEQQRQVFEDYVTHMLKRHARPWRYPAQKTRRWLIWLAQQMKKQHITEFYVEYLQRSWLSMEWMVELFPWISGLFFGLVFGLLIGLVFAHIAGLFFGLIMGLAVAFVFGRIFGQSYKLLGGLQYGNIAPVDKIKWSWKNILQSRIGSWNWLIFSISVGFLYGSFIGYVLNHGWFYGLVGAVISTPATVLVGGFAPIQVEKFMRLEPNQGIYNSGRNALRVGLFSGLFLGLAYGLTNALISGLFNGLIELVIGGLIFGLYLGLIRGGSAYINHYILRFFLWRSNAIAWYYVRFLNEAVDRVLLQRVGGGYRFVHPLFQDYFASLDAGVPASEPELPSQRIGGQSKFVGE